MANVSHDQNFKNLILWGRGHLALARADRRARSPAMRSRADAPCGAVAARLSARRQNGLTPRSPYRPYGAPHAVHACSSPWLWEIRPPFAGHLP